MIKYVKDYIDGYYAGTVKFNRERVDLVNYIKREIEPRIASGEIYFDSKQIENCINYIEKWFFPLEEFQKFIISFIFLYFTENHRNVYRKIFIMIARGNGKNGLISGIISYLSTPMHGIKKYNISIVANSEDQAKTSFDEIYDTIESNSKLEKLFGKPGKKEIKNIQTKSILKYRTSNGNTKDGLRDGAVVFDEIHQYESNKDVKVHISGLGKRPNPREFYIGTDGYVRDGFIDRMKDLAKRVLDGTSKKWNAIFPFICKLDDERQVDDKDKWELANPMFSEPMSEYAQGLFETVCEDYDDLEEEPSGREEFMTKRMDLPVTDTERSVATYEELVATKQEFPDTRGLSAVGGFDFASIRDFAAVGVLFRIDDTYVFKAHSFVRKAFVDQIYGYSKPKDSINGKKQYAPIKKWEEQGFLTVLDEPSINPRRVAAWFAKMRDEEGLEFKAICGDRFRLDILGPAFEEFGFTIPKGKKEEISVDKIEIINNPRAIDSLLAPRIEDAFANLKVNFGDNDMMRWYTQNVLRRLKGDGNVEYVKKEDVRRKTDGFKAFEYAMYRADEIVQSVGEDFTEITDWFF